MKSSMLIGGMMAVANGAFLPSDNIPWKAYKKCGVRPNVQTIDEPTFGRRKREFDWLEYGNDLNGNIEEHIDLLSREKRDKMRADTRVNYNILKMRRVRRTTVLSKSGLFGRTFAHLFACLPPSTFDNFIVHYPNPSMTWTDNGSLSVEA